MNAASCRSALMCGVLTTFLSLSASAQTVDPELAGLLVAESCAPETVKGLRKLLAIELDSLEQERAWSVAEHIREVYVRCDGEHADLEARAVTGQSVSARVNQSKVQKQDRARALALAATELVDQLRVEASVERAPAPPKPPEPKPDIQPLPVERPVRRTRPATLSLLLGGGLERVGRPAVTLPSLSMIFRPRLGRYFEFSQELDLARGTVGTELSAVELETYSTAANLLIGTSLPALRWGLGPGVRAGYVRMQGSPAAGSGFTGEQVNGFWAGANLLAHITMSPQALANARVIERFDVLLSAFVEAGLVAIPLVGTEDNDRTVFEVDGAWLKVALCVGLAI